MKALDHLQQAESEIQSIVCLLSRSFLCNKQEQLVFLVKKVIIRLPNKMEEMVEDYMSKHGLQLNSCGVWTVLLTV